MKNRNFKISITGHRLFPNMSVERQTFMHDITEWLTENYDIEEGSTKQNLILMHGCALGVDMWFGEIAMKLNLPLELHLPFPADMQKKKAKMNSERRKMLDIQMAYADKIIVVNQSYFTYGYQKRNMSLVDHCDRLIGYFTRIRSGSGNCARYYTYQTGNKVFNVKTGRDI